MQSKESSTPGAIVFGLLLLLCVACVSLRHGPLAASTQAKVTYKPIAIPIVIELDLLSGQPSVAIDGNVQTPIGTFGVGGSVSLEKERRLVLQLGAKEVVYKLKKGVHFEVVIPNDDNLRSTVSADGVDGDLYVRIPSPHNVAPARMRARIGELETENANLKAKLVEARVRSDRLDLPRSTSKVVSIARQVYVPPSFALTGGFRADLPSRWVAVTGTGHGVDAALADLQLKTQRVYDVRRFEIDNAAQQVADNYVRSLATPRYYR